MEFVNVSSPIHDIKVPEGNVIKIIEKSTQKVLWEKGVNISSLKPEVNLIQLDEISPDYDALCRRISFIRPERNVKINGAFNNKPGFLAMRTIVNDHFPQYINGQWNYRDDLPYNNTIYEAPCFYFNSTKKTWSLITNESLFCRVGIRNSNSHATQGILDVSDDGYAFLYTEHMATQYQDSSGTSLSFPFNLTNLIGTNFLYNEHPVIGNTKDKNYRWKFIPPSISTYVKDNHDLRSIPLTFAGTINGGITSPPKSLRIIHSPERGEYLVSGIHIVDEGHNKFEFLEFVFDEQIPAFEVNNNTIPQSNIQTTKSTYGMYNPCWCPPHYAYYGISIGDVSPGNCFKCQGVRHKSTDGKSWTILKPGTLVEIQEIQCLKERGILLAIGSDNSILISFDGENWITKSPKDTIFTGAYCPEYDFFLGISRSMNIYITRDFSNWEKTSISVPFVGSGGFFHLGDGIFAGTDIEGKYVVIITTVHHIRGKILL